MGRPIGSGRGCAICKSPDRALYEHMLTSGDRLEDIVQAAAERGFKVSLGQLSTHRSSHTQAPEPVDPELQEELELLRKELREEMQGQPTLVKAQYFVVIATIGDVLSPGRIRDAKAAMAAIKTIQDFRGASGQGDVTKAFMAGAVAMAKQLVVPEAPQLEPTTTEVTVGVPEAPSGTRTSREVP